MSIFLLFNNIFRDIKKNKVTVKCDNKRELWKAIIVTIGIDSNMQYYLT